MALKYRAIGPHKTRKAADKWIAQQEGPGVFRVREDESHGPFGRFVVEEVVEVCDRSGLVPAKCACQQHVPAGFAAR